MKSDSYNSTVQTIIIITGIIIVNSNRLLPVSLTNRKAANDRGSCSCPIDEIGEEVHRVMHWAGTKAHVEEVAGGARASHSREGEKQLRGNEAAPYREDWW